MANLSFSVASDPGLRREENEDAYCARADLGLYMVADGMGGHAAGEVASRLAVEVVENFINDTRDADINTTWPFPYDPALSHDGNRLKAAMRLANRRIAGAVERDPSLKGMATTAAALLIGPEGITVAHVGDSRVYRSRKGALQQVTDDHSWVGEQVRAGSLTEADAKQHPWRNVVTRALAGGEDPEVDVAEVPAERGDVQRGAAVRVTRVGTRAGRDQRGDLRRVASRGGGEEPRVGVDLLARGRHLCEGGAGQEQARADRHPGRPTKHAGDSMPLAGRWWRISRPVRFTPSSGLVRHAAPVLALGARGHHHRQAARRRAAEGAHV